MKKLFFSFLIAVFSVCGIYAQSYTTGDMTFFGNYSGRIDVTSSTVTVTLVGPSTSWLGIGFNATTMDDVGRDVIIFDGTSITDRSFNGIGVIPPTDTQNWSLSSNNVVTGVRTVVMTRARVATEGTDYTFPLAAQPLDVIFARRTGSTVIGYHGAGNCGTTTANFTLGTNDFVMESLKVYPNPSKEFFTIEFPDQVTKGEVKVYDAVGKLIKQQNVSTIENKISTTGLSSGSYFMILRTDYGNATRTLVID
ncbi:T9SS type A sorting domain-containing protein [Flavobacterium amniphilum]|uniref:T9SS type A sorting domain-containing protein n=1 Tax=Flavobacterium amniphilum TaxID=1834035 RepID=UPI00202ABFCA|nr:T9SS type A sorting domain-containing protein [Flavobacterium amniphilum]MCL9806855.1 T9SS type A sorting domain-containing protein [Flavobacterium amniphilum]